MRKIVLGIMLLIITVSFSLAGCGGGPSVENVRWILLSYGDPETPYAILEDTEIKVRFNSGTEQLRGYGGCNHYTGEYEINGNVLTIIGPFAVTEMWCGKEIGDQESAYLELLLAAESYQVDGAVLTINSGNNVLYFEREE